MKKKKKKPKWRGKKEKTNSMRGMRRERKNDQLIDLKLLKSSLSPSQHCVCQGMEEEEKKKWGKLILSE